RSPNGGVDSAAARKGSKKHEAYFAEYAMIGVSANDDSSSASRMAPTRPSIMSEGATMSAPASACDTAVRASSSSVGSLRTAPSSTTPQWPCLVYSQRQTSVMTSSSGTVTFTARTASGTMP